MAKPRRRRAARSGNKPRRDRPAAAAKAPSGALRVAAAHHAAGEFEAARAAYRQILSDHPATASAWHGLGLMAYQSNEPSGLPALERAVALDPHRAEFRNTLGAAFNAVRRFEPARDAFEVALRIDPDYAQARNNLGIALLGLRRPGDAIDCFRRALRSDPDYLEARANLGHALFGQDRYAEALQQFEALVGAGVRDAVLFHRCAVANERLHRMDAARRHAEAALRIAPATDGARLVLARIERRAGNLDSALARLREIPTPTENPATDVEAANLRGKVFHDLGRHPEAFAAFEAANRRALADPRARAVLTRPGVDSYQSIALQQQWFSASRVATWDRKPPGDGIGPPVFLVGFPRSGTTLLGQVLAAHSAVCTLEERPAIEPLVADFLLSGRTLDDLDRLGADEVRDYRRRYAERLRAYAADAGPATLVVDKYPMNILGLGLIHRFFPEARIIVALRDPRDVCLSCFMQHFRFNGAMAHFLELGETACYYAAVMTLLNHFMAILPARFHVVRYEDVVAAPAETVGPLLSFLGLPWEDSVLSHQHAARGREIHTPSYEQVVEPIRRGASGRWRRYAEQLAPVLPTLDPFVRAFGYGPTAAQADQDQSPA